MLVALRPGAGSDRSVFWPARVAQARDKAPVTSRKRDLGILPEAPGYLRHAE